MEFVKGFVKIKRPERDKVSFSLFCQRELADVRDGTRKKNRLFPIVLTSGP